MTPTGRDRVADLVIAGVTKGGTTSMFSYLAQHPEVCASDVKEVRYFSPLRYGEPLGPLADYTRHFRHATDERYTLEATPGYLYGGRALAEGIEDVSPGARIILTLRSPADRCWSWYNFVRSRARLDKTLGFEEYLERCLTLHQAGADGTRENQAFWGLGGGCYDSWLPDWMDVFGERLRVVFFDDLVRDPSAVVVGLCRWLDIDPVAAAAIDFAQENRTEQFRNRAAQQVALAVNRRTETFFRKHRGVKRLLRGAYYGVNRDSSQVLRSTESDEFMAWFYSDHLVALTRQLSTGRGPNLPPWLRPADQDGPGHLSESESV